MSAAPQAVAKLEKIPPALLSLTPSVSLVEDGEDIILDKIVQGCAERRFELRVYR